MQHQSLIEILTIAIRCAQPATIYIIGVIASLFVISLLSLIRGYKCFYTDYRQIISALRPFERNSGTREETFDHLRSTFKSNQSFGHPWNEFSESIVKERKEDGEFEYRNTLEAHDFFNVDAIISSSRAWLFSFRLGTFGSIPNILTGLGIVGTFFGILSGIPEGVAPDAISKGIPYFLIGMKGAFLASLSGLILALVFTFVEKYLMDLMETQCRLLAERLDTLFRRAHFTSFRIDLYPS